MRSERVQGYAKQRHSVALLLIGAYAALATPAQALPAEPTPTELAVARRLFQEASELESEGEWAIAAAKLRDAIQIKDTPGLRFHLAHCEERLGLLVEAALDYDRARDLLAAGAKAPDVEALLEPARESLAARLPTLVIVIPAGVPDLSVSLNGRQLARSILGRPAPVNPGKYHIVVTAPGYDPFVRDVTIKESERTRVAAELVRRTEASPAAAPTPTVQQERGPLDGAPPQTSEPHAGPGLEADLRTYVILGESLVTAAGLGLGIGFLLAKDDAAERAREAQGDIGEGARCDSQSTDDDLLASCRRLDDAVSDHDRARVLSTVGFVGAGVGAASIVLTVLFWPDTESSVRVSARPSRSGAFFAVSGQF